MRPPFKCHGGKSYLAKWIIENLPSNYQEMLYFEPFCGGASVLLNKEPSQEEVINDLDENIIILFRILRDQCTQFLRKIKRVDYEEVHFDAALKRKEFSDDLHRAINEFILRRMSRGGLKKAFAWSNRKRGGQPGEINAWETILDLIPEISQRLQKVIILNKSAIELLKLFDEPNVLCYCLPPWQKVRTESEELIEIEKIKDGDILFGGRKVLKKMSKEFNGDLLKFKVQGVAEPLELTSEHKLVRIKGHGNKRQETRTLEELWNLKEIVPANDIKINDYLLLPLGGKTKKVEFLWNDLPVKNGKRRADIKFKVCPELYRYLGYYAAEGHINRQKGKPVAVVLSFNKDELETWIKDTVFCIKEAFGIECKVGPGPKNTPNVIQVTINSTTIAEFTSFYVSGTAKNKQLHLDLMSDEFCNQKEILKAWLRGDGGIEYSSRNRVKLTGTRSSNALAKQMYTIGLRCGLRPNFKKREDNFDVYFAGADAKELDYFVPCKKFRNTRRIINNCMLVRVKDIMVNKYRGVVYDIDVDKDDLFTAPFVLIHNCDPPYLHETRESPDAYTHEMAIDDHIALADVLNGFKGKVLISGYPSRLYSKLYKNWRCEKKKIANHASQQKVKPIKMELLWCNF